MEALVHMVEIAAYTIIHSIEEAGEMVTIIREKEEIQALRNSSDVSYIITHRVMNEVTHWMETSILTLWSTIKA